MSMTLVDFLSDDEKLEVKKQSKYDFYTVGYEGLGIRPFIAILKKNGVQTLVDIRYNPYSQNPDFSKLRLSATVENNGIKYVHLQKYGIPSNIRKQGIGQKWYEENVLPHISKSILDTFERSPVAFMCMEKDVNNCHRGWVLKRLTSQGVKGKDLVST